jgi:probable addiction module antidote protein
MSEKKEIRTFPYDAAEFLRDNEDCALYLQAVMEEDGVTTQNIAAALGDIARARGMTRLARETGLAREALYRALSRDGNPSLSTLLKVTRALGVQLTTRPRAA